MRNAITQPPAMVKIHVRAEGGKIGFFDLPFVKRGVFKMDYLTIVVFGFFSSLDITYYNESVSELV